MLRFLFLPLWFFRIHQKFYTNYIYAIINHVYIANCRLKFSALFLSQTGLLSLLSTYY